MIMQQNERFHHPWTTAPQTLEEFQKYIERIAQPNQEGFIVEVAKKEIAGVFNISEIVLGCFQSGYLGFYATEGFAGKGIMSKAMKLILQHAFETIKLHRLEANIQPSNAKSIHLIQANGFRKEGLSLNYLNIAGQWRDHERWAITYEDWVKG
jgi:ribosomal-protein-alanine N-acetyltransferase